MQKEFTFEERIRQDVLLLTIDEEFLADVKEIRIKYNLPIRKEDRDKFGMHPIDKDKNFDKDFKDLRKKYNVPESHELALGGFVVNGYLGKASYSSDLWHLNPSTKTSEMENCVMLKIYPDTTLKDIQKNWQRIKFVRNGLLNRGVEKKVRIENLERDMEILQLKRAGQNSKEIMSLINKDNRFKKVILGYEDISKIIQRLKNMSKKNMARKKS